MSDGFDVAVTGPDTFDVSIAPAIAGAPGPAGVGVPTGGTTGQALTKNTATDYDTGWATIAGGGGGGGNLTLNETAVKTSDYTAAAGEFVLFDTTTAARTLTLPAAPANGTLVGARIVTFGAGNYVSVAAAGSDVFNKLGGSTIATNVLQVNATSILYQYSSGVWTLVATGMTVPQLDLRYSAFTPTGTISSTTVAGAIAEVSQDITDLPTLTTSDTVKVPITTAAGVTELDVDDLATLADVVAGSTGTTYVRASADGPAVNNNSTTYTNDPAVTIAVLANAVYDVAATIYHDGSQAADFKFGWNLPTGCSGETYVVRQDASLTTLAVMTSGLNAWSSNHICGGTNVNPNTTTCAVTVKGTLIVGSTAGDMQLRYAQNTATAQNTYRKAGTIVILRRLA